MLEVHRTTYTVLKRAVKNALVAQTVRDAQAIVLPARVATIKVKKNNIKQSPRQSPRALLVLQKRK